MKLPFGLTGIWGYLVLGLLALGLIAAIVGGAKSCKQTDADQDNQLVNAGVSQERAQSQGKALDNVKKADDAVRAPTADDEQRVCEKYDRNCSRKGS